MAACHRGHLHDQFQRLTHFGLDRSRQILCQAVPAENGLDGFRIVLVERQFFLKNAR